MAASGLHDAAPRVPSPRSGSSFQRGYGQALRWRSTFGRIGVKVWIYKGDVVGGRRESEINAPAADRRNRGERRERPRRGGQRRQRAEQKQEG